MKKLTHDDLCNKATSWLKRPFSKGGYGCPIAVKEMASGSNGGEIADSFGLKISEGTETIVVEAKCSISDFNADKNKPFRVNTSLGMGNYRYFICEEGLIKPEDLPEKWGLIYVGKRGKITVVAGHKHSPHLNWWFESNRDAELGATSLIITKSRDVDVDEAIQLKRSNRRLEKKLQEVTAKLEESEKFKRIDEIIRGLDKI